jgi:putative restriction endonuclease
MKSMRFWVGVTDNDWFKFLSKKLPDEVNFWQPSGEPPFTTAVEPGAPFLFKLKKPYHHIAGGGIFVKYTNLPVSVAWEIFGEKNGTSSYRELLDQILRYRKNKGQTQIDPSITCVVVTQPFFFNQNDWIPAPDNLSPFVVRGKKYGTDEPIGARLWAEVQATLNGVSPDISEIESTSVPEEGERYGSPYLRANRLGQGAFQVIVRDAYNRQCAITGEPVLHVLDAAHIKPYSESGPHTVNNGLLLRVDWHRLFDRFFITIKESKNKDFRIEVSKRIREDCENGGYYYGFHGEPLKVLPSQAGDLPAKEYIEWHNNEFDRRE